MENYDIYSVIKMTLSLFKGKQKARILWFLGQQPLRFSELKRALDPISKKVLSDQLQDLERIGIIKKEIYPEVPVKVVYSMTELGYSCRPIFEEIKKWQDYYRKEHTHRITKKHLLIDDYSGDLIFDIIGDKWKPELLRILDHKTLRFGEIKKELPHISQKVLTEQLREMEQHGLVERVVYNEKTPRVEYNLTEVSHSLKPIFYEMVKWGKYYLSLKENNHQI